MPWPWTRPKSPTGFLDDVIPPSSLATSATSAANGVASLNNPSSSGARTSGLARQSATTSTSRSTTPTPASSTWPASINHTGRSASSLGFTPEAPIKNHTPRRHSRDTTNLNGSTPPTAFRTAAAIPEEQSTSYSLNGDYSTPSSSSGTPNSRPVRQASTREGDRKAAQSPDLLSRPQHSVESLSSVASSLQSDSLNNHSHHGKRSLSAGSHLAMFPQGQMSPNFSNGRAFSPTPSIGSTNQATVTRSQKAIIPPGSRQSTASEEVCYELPESLEQVNGLNSHEIEERDLRHKAVVELNPVPVPSNHNRTRSTLQSRESMLEAEVARLRKLCDRYKRASVNASSSSIGSVTDSLNLPDVSSAAAGSSEAARVVKVMKVANEHLQKKIDARDTMLADRLAELETIYNRHAIELEQQKQGFQLQFRQASDLHKRELEVAKRRTLEQVEAVRREAEQSNVVVETHQENQQEHLNKIAALQAEIEALKNLEKTQLDGHSAALEELKLQAAEEMVAAKKAWAEAEEGWEIKTEEMRRQLLDERRVADCNCGSESDSNMVDQLKKDHENEIVALKTSIRILEGSRGTTVEQLEEDQRVYRKVSELEASLSSKVRALTAERKTSERLRASLIAADEAKAELQKKKDDADAKLLAQVESHERLLSEAMSGSGTFRTSEVEAIEEELRQATARSIQELTNQKDKYESELEIERARVSQLQEQHETDAQEFDNRITELIKEHIQEKDRSDTVHSAALKVLEKQVKEQMEAEFAAFKSELEERESSLQIAVQERDAKLASSQRNLDEGLQQLRATFDKEKEVLIAEYQVVINAGNRLRDQDQASFRSEKEQLEQLLADAKQERQSLQEQSESNISQVKLEHSREKQTLQTAIEEAKDQLAAQINAFELRLQSELQEAEQRFQIRRNTEKQIEAAKFEEAKAELDRNRGEFYAEIQRLQTENTETKDRAAQVVSELQQQLKDDEECKQQLLDRVAKAETEKDTTEIDLTNIKSRFDGANTALREQTEALRKAEGQIKTLNESNQAARNELENEKRASAQTISELRSQMQNRETIAKDFRNKQLKEIEDLQFQIRTLQTKLEINDIEIESLKETIRQKEGTITVLRDEKSSYGTVWVDEKHALVNKHNQIMEGHLSTIAKLEDTINKMRIRTTEEARAAEAKAAEQQGLVAQWVSSSNRKADEVQRLDRALKEAISKAESFKLDVKALKNDLKQSEKDSKDQKAEIKSLSKDLKSAQDENASLKSHMESSSSSSYRHARQIADLETKMQALAKEIHDSRSEITVHKRTVAKRDSTIRQLEDALQQRGTRNGRASPGPNVSLQASMENGIVPTSTSSNALQRELRESKAEITRLTDKLEMYETEYRHFFEDHEKLKVEHEEGQKTMKVKLDAIIPELEQLRKSKKDLEQRLQSAELRLATSGGLRRGVPDSDGPILRSQSSMSYLRHGEISIGSLNG
ncbi:hypothetical protein H072_1245 [Dactylellina haptotyla CBS 200.50]|uniref:Uncharacterized protein n=1 Tax=Dactylellina haptotyla (strain CBS 200.50) TaxID=1284197 RepID=S8CAJ4_DACHA|nr:hypothetical protein H072_1245 [Dactylellina haptotyla CBS 200.50]